MLFLVDGYNVTMKDPATAHLAKEAQRQALVARLRTRGPSLLGAGSIVIVFDAREELGTSSEDVGAVEVAYARDADDEIVRRSIVAAGEVTVVTDDMRLRARLSQDVPARPRYHDASTCFEAARSARRSRRVRREEGLPTGANEITRELKELWLGEDKNGGADK